MVKYLLAMAGPALMVGLAFSNISDGLQAVVVMLYGWYLIRALA